MSGTTVCVSPAQMQSPPDHCSKDTFGDDAYNNLCQPHKKALDSLWSALATDPSTPNPILSLPLAKCRVISSDFVENASNNGLDIQKLKSTWYNSSTAGSGSACENSAYGVFDKSTGELVASSADALYQEYFSDCTSEQDKSLQNYIYSGSNFQCRSVALDAKCQDPLTTTFTKCRNPGWDYLNTDSGQWRYDFSKGCTIASEDGGQFTGAEAVVGGVDVYNCQEQCCIYKSASLDNNTADCQSCTQAASKNNYSRDWSGVSDITGTTPTITFTNSETDQKIELPYCNSAFSTKQGIAMSLTDATTADNVGEFGDPADCMPGGAFEGRCAGITGCDGLWGTDQLDLNFAPCRLGFSSTRGNPATNCPNLYTVENAGRECLWSTKFGRTCTPGQFGTSDPTCDAIQANDQYLTSGESGFPRVDQLTIPEGAWVTAFQSTANPPDTAPNRANYAMCDPNNFGKNGVNAWTFGCGRNTDGDLVGSSKSFVAKNTEAWTDGTEFYGVDTSSVDESGRTCTFNMKANTPMYGFQFGFQPGYYNSTCTTGTTGSNQCGTITP